MSAAQTRVQVVIRGAGDLATGVAFELHRQGFTRLVLLETAAPLAVRRKVCLSEAVYEGEARVQGLCAELVRDAGGVRAAFARGRAAVLVDEDLSCLSFLRPEVLVDAVIAKKNLGTRPDLAPLVLALGPGFHAPTDAHAVIETNRGPHLGHIYWTGSAQPNTGIPAPVMGVAAERVLRAPCDGRFESARRIGEHLACGDVVGYVDESPVTSAVAGVLRGLLRPGLTVGRGLKLGDVDPRDDPSLCAAISDKALALGRAVAEAMRQAAARPAEGVVAAQD